MSNAELFKKVFGIYAEEFWAYPEEKMLDWLTSNVPDTNVGDMISRQAAIDAIEITSFDDYGDYIRARELIESLPSEQPDLDEWCTDCKEYDQEKHCCPRWNRVIRNTLKDAQLEPRWIPVTEQLPEKHRSAIVTDFGHVTLAYTNNLGEWMDYDGNRLKNVIAWQPLPKPYERSGDGN